MPYCKNCGAQIAEDARFCEECGAAQTAAPAQAAVAPSPAAPAAAPGMAPGMYSRKDGALAAILSFIIPGVGQIYCGRVGRGIAFFIGTICLVWFLIGIGIWIWGIFDANDSAKKYNAYLDAYGQPPVW
jgi:TM2 domain-containing membrane protein YozV